jgi:pimeloyl-ACP methyl ester carboxylesterase
VRHDARPERERPSVPRRGARWVAWTWRLGGLALAALAFSASGERTAAAGGGQHYPVPAAPPPPPNAADLAHVAVQVKADGGVVLAGTYARNGAGAGSPALLLVHGEYQSRAAWTPLLSWLDEYRVPWLSIDMRGHGESRVQSGKDLEADITRKDPELFASLADDVAAGVRFLVEEKGHDKDKIGVLASRLGASAALKFAHEHKDAVAALMMMTPSMLYPGFTSDKDAADTNGKMDFVVFSSIEDNRKDEKKNAIRILYTAEAARNAPPDTPLDERITKRRGIPPRFRSFDVKDATGTAMITAVAHFDAWIAAWWGRRLGTYPHAVLYDGSVDPQNDYADPEWTAGADIPSRGDRTAKALRWGRRVMVGASLPKDVRSIHLRIHATRGDRQVAGQFARIDYPSGIVTANPIVRGFGRAPPTETSALVLEPEEIPVKQGRETVLTYGDPSFECEIRLPEVSGSGPYVVRLSWAVSRGSGDPENAETFVEEDPATWTVVPDQLEGTKIPYLPADEGPAATPLPRETPDGPTGPK